MHKLTNYTRAIYGLSLLTVSVFVTQGANAAREMLTQARRAAKPRLAVNLINWWNLARLFPSDKKIVLSASDWEDGCTAPLERFFLAQLLNFFSPKLALEVGTFLGSTTFLFLDNLPAQSRIFTIDLPLQRKLENIAGLTDERIASQNRVGSVYSTHPRASNVTQIYGNTMEKSTWEKVPSGIDFAFIDASHSYEAVKNDTEFVFSKLSENGVIAWHDYTDEETYERGVGKYLRELMKDRSDIFLIEDTNLVLRIPIPILFEQAKGITAFYPTNNFFRHFPNGALPWIKTNA